MKKLKLKKHLFNYYIVLQFIVVIHIMCVDLHKNNASMKRNNCLRKMYVKNENILVSYCYFDIIMVNCYKYIRNIKNINYLARIYVFDY